MNKRLAKETEHLTVEDTELNHFLVHLRGYEMATTAQKNPGSKSSLIQ